MSRSFPRLSWRLPSVALATFAMLSIGGAADLLAQCPAGGYNPPPSKGRGNSNPSGPATPGPSGPSTPGPATPSTPGPGTPGPTTGGPAVPGPTTGGPGNAPPPGPRTGAPAGPRAPRGLRGTPLTFERGHTSKELLQIDWDYPVYDPAAAHGEGNKTRAVIREALAAEDAFEILAGDDRRPLLVVRECMSCVGSDVALLNNGGDNERTILLTHWFHCVKLPPHVVDYDHPFHNLFRDHDKTHLFLSSWDGTGRVELNGAQSQSKLWKAMTEVLRRDYEGNADGAVKELLKLLNQFDRVDGLEADLMQDLDRELERSGSRSTKLAKIQAKLKEVGEQRKKLLERERELRELTLRAPEPETADAGK